MGSLVRRATVEDVPFIESVINHPDVRGFMGMGERPLSFDKTIEYALAYVSEHGVIFSENMGNNTFVALVAFLPGGRGLHSMVAMRETMIKMFTETECRRILGTISLDPINKKMLRAASVLGFGPPHRMGNRAIVDVEYPTWAVTSSDCHLVGLGFVDEHEIELQAEDQAAALGAFLMTAKNGLLAKAVTEYEVYAVLSNTKPIIFSGNADRLYLGDRDITDAVMSLTGV